MKRNAPDDSRTHPDPSKSCGCVGAASCFICPATSASVVSAPSSSCDAFIQTEFDKLSPAEQDKIFRDLYGMDDSVVQLEENDPQLINTKLGEMDNELNSIKSKAAYEQATMHCHSSYMMKLKLMFLRAELYHTKKAARRLVKHWTEKVDIFGFEIAMKGPIKQSDLNKDDMDCLACGGLQVVPGRDRAGRPLYFIRREFFRYQTLSNMLRAVWYLLMSELERFNEDHRNGAVAIIYNVGTYPLEFFDRDMFSQLFKKVIQAIPYRTVGYHSCFNDIKLRAIVPFVLLFMGKDMRARYRSHVGSHPECLFEISTYGIPLNVLPVSMDGRFDLSAHYRWIETTRTLEGQEMDE